ncbi:MAG: PilW family protein [Burkholderiales bacterium]|nr:PilW family protein [Burkholderiales bacterium]
MPTHTFERPRSPHPLARGISIVELMIGLVVGLLVSLAAAGGAQLFTAAQRQGIGVGSGGSGAASALASIKTDVANGGLGFFGSSTYGCTKLNLSVDTVVAADGIGFSPIQATRVGSNDQLDVMYGSDVTAGASTRVAGVANSSAATVKEFLPGVVGKAVVLAPQAAGTPCLMRTVTAATTPTATDKQVLTFGATGKYNQGSFTTTPTYPADSTVSIVGTLRWHRYALNGTNLTMTQVLDGSSVTLLRNVIGFRVEYGVSDASAGSTTLDSWVEPNEAGWLAFDATSVRRLRAVRIGIVVRSAQREKAENDGVCRASAAKPVLWGNTIEPDVTDWQCFRYRTQIVVAPMRNVVYGKGA